MKKFTHVFLMLFLLLVVAEAGMASDSILIKNGTIVPIKGGSNMVGDLLIENQPNRKKH